MQADRPAKNKTPVIKANATYFPKLLFDKFVP
jgi:hypothetical protein